MKNIKLRIVYLIPVSYTHLDVYKRQRHYSFSDIHTLVSNNLMCVRQFTVDRRTLFLYNIMCDCQSEVSNMNAKERIEELLEASEDGTITAAQVTEAGLHRSVLQEFVKSGEMYRFGRGLYVRSSAWEDDFYLLQRKYGRGIYSHDTALYLLGYSDRTPAKYTMTFPKGYNAPSLKPVSYTHLTQSDAKDLLRNTIVATVNKVYLDRYLEEYQKQKEKAPDEQQT